MIEVIKEFLISLGFQTDSSSLNTARRAMAIAETSVAQFGSTTVTNFAKAETGIVSFVAVASLALAKYMTSLGEADLSNQMLARRFWMSSDAARAYTSSIDALGVSLQDLYLSPELMHKYLELNQMSKGMAVPSADYEQSMQGIRSITFEFQKLRLEGTYALQWVGFYLTKYLAGPMEDSKKWLESVNDTIQQKMPEWTAKVAGIVSQVVRLGSAIWSIRDAILGAFAATALIKVLSSPIAMLIFRTPDMTYQNI